MCGEYADMERLSKTVLENARELLDKVRVYEIRINSLYSQNNTSESLKTALEVLRLLGIRFPEKPNRLHVLIGLYCDYRSPGIK